MELGAAVAQCSASWNNCKNNPSPANPNRKGTLDYLALQRFNSTDKKAAAKFENGKLLDHPNVAKVRSITTIFFCLEISSTSSHTALLYQRLSGSQVLPNGG